MQQLKVEIALWGTWNGKTIGLVRCQLKEPSQWYRQCVCVCVCLCDPETVLVNKLKIRTQTNLAKQYHSFLWTTLTNTPRSAVVICTQPRVSNYHRLDCFDTGLSYHRISFAVHITSVHCFDDRNEGHVCSSDRASCLPAWLKPVAHWSWG